MIYDCFTFFDELEVLELRLNILAEVADRFVLVEADRTHAGLPKPLHFQDHRARFAAFADRIIHVVVRDFPPQGASAWGYENFQRNAIARGLGGAQPDDVILVSDVDEIINPVAVRATRAWPGIKAFRQRMFYYYLDAELARKRWTKARMVTFSDLTTAQALRDFSGRPDFGPPGPGRMLRRTAWVLLGKPRRGLVVVPGGGWHFSYLGSPDRILRKIQSFAHQEYNTPAFADLERIRWRMERALDPFGRRGHRLRFVPIDATYPVYLRRNLDRYRHLLGGAAGRVPG